jgi:hypothetical protein
MVKTDGLTPEDVWDDPPEAPERQPWPLLQYSQEEVALVHKFFPCPDIPNIPELHPTTKQAVEVMEMGVPIVHLSCHGYID